jgi:hypothetical protein
MNDECHTRPRSRVGTTSAAALILTLAALSIGIVACDPSPSDDARIASLSPDEVVALCDELRDAVSVADHPVECSDWPIQWVVPSNQHCRDADLEACDATAGDVRGWHEAARRDPCSLHRSSQSVGFGERGAQAGCSELIPRLTDADVPCTPGGLANLEKFDGVYEVTSAAVLSEVACDTAPPAVLEPDAPRFVVVSTQTSGVPEAILKSCGDIPDCQALARAIRTQGDPGPREPDSYRYDHFVDCRGPTASDAFILESRLPEGVPACQLHIRSRTELMLLVSDLTLAERPLSVLAKGMGTPSTSPGCGYVVAPSAREFGACAVLEEYTAVLVAPL